MAHYTSVKPTEDEIAAFVAKKGHQPTVGMVQCDDCGKRIWNSGLGRGAHDRSKACRSHTPAAPVAADTTEAAPTVLPGQRVRITGGRFAGIETTPSEITSDGWLRFTTNARRGYGIERQNVAPGNWEPVPYSTGLHEFAPEAGGVVCVTPCLRPDGTVQPCGDPVKGAIHDPQAFAAYARELESELAKWARRGGADELVEVTTETGRKLVRRSELAADADRRTAAPSATCAVCQFGEAGTAHTTPLGHPCHGSASSLEPATVERFAQTAANNATTLLQDAGLFRVTHLGAVLLTRAHHSGDRAEIGKGEGRAAQALVNLGMATRPHHAIIELTDRGRAWIAAYRRMVEAEGAAHAVAARGTGADIDATRAALVAALRKLFKLTAAQAKRAAVEYADQGEGMLRAVGVATGRY